MEFWKLWSLRVQGSQKNWNGQGTEEKGKITPILTQAKSTCDENLQIFTSFSPQLFADVPHHFSHLIGTKCYSDIAFTSQSTIITLLNDAVKLIPSPL